MTEFGTKLDRNSPAWTETFAKAAGLWRDDSLDQIHRAIAIERPPQAFGLDDLLKTSNTVSEFLVGSASPAPFFADVQALIDYLDEKPTPATQDRPMEVINSLEKLRGIQNDLNGDKTIGGGPTPAPGPAVVRYSVPGFTVSFTGPKANLSPAVTDQVEGGSGCGDPAKGLWMFPLTISELGPANTRSNAVSFAQQNLGTLITHNFTVNKTAPTGSIAIHLRYTAGDAPAVKVEIAATGDITAVTAPPNALPVTLTKVAAC